MKNEGPAIEALLRRMAETPRDFLDPPRIGENAKNGDSLNVTALVYDLSHQINEACTQEELRPQIHALAPDTHWLSLCAMACWLLSDDSLRLYLNKAALMQFLNQTLREIATGMSKKGAVEKYLLDPERREEFVRHALADLDLRPAGETEAQAQDRLQALSSTERRRMIEAARQTEKRAREIREALIQKAAAEAADKYTRE